MRVGVSFPGFPPESGGGYTFEKGILDALIDLAPQGHHQFTLFFQTNPPGIPEFRSSNLQKVILGEEKPVSKVGSFAKRLTTRMGMTNSSLGENAFRRAVRQERIEFVWFPTSIYDPIDTPYIATVWDIQHRLQPWFPEVSAKGQWEYREAYYATYLRRATYIITANESGMREISLFYQLPRDRFRMIPHPAPRVVKSSNPDAVAKVLVKYGIPSLYLFYPAQFWPHKNHANLLFALQILRNQYHIDIDLVLTGSDQGNMQYVQKMVEERALKNSVHFLGFVPSNELIALYEGAFALTYVTFFGPENLPPLEAFAYGCPVIASNVAGSQEQLGDAALKVDARIPEDIALAVKRLTDDPALRNSLINNGRWRASSFTNISFVSKVFEMLDEFEPIRRTWQ
jgi:glycosyltransferase involved in cell wall biosynthesis